MIGDGSSVYFRLPEIHGRAIANFFLEASAEKLAMALPRILAPGMEGKAIADFFLEGLNKGFGYIASIVNEQMAKYIG